MPNTTPLAKNQILLPNINVDKFTTLLAKITQEGGNALTKKSATDYEFNGHGMKVEIHFDEPTSTVLVTIVNKPWIVSYGEIEKILTAKLEAAEPPPNAA